MLNKVVDELITIILFFAIQVVCMCLSSSMAGTADANSTYIYTIYLNSLLVAYLCLHEYVRKD